MLFFDWFFLAFSLPCWIVAIELYCVIGTRFASAHHRYCGFWFLAMLAADWIHSSFLTDTVPACQIQDTIVHCFIAWFTGALSLPLTGLLFLLICFTQCHIFSTYYAVYASLSISTSVLRCLRCSSPVSRHFVFAFLFACSFLSSLSLSIYVLDLFALFSLYLVLSELSPWFHFFSILRISVGQAYEAAHTRGTETLQLVRARPVLLYGTFMSEIPSSNSLKRELTRLRAAIGRPSGEVLQDFWTWRAIWMISKITLNLTTCSPCLPCAQIMEEFILHRLTEYKSKIFFVRLWRRNGFSLERRCRLN